MIAKIDPKIAAPLMTELEASNRKRVREGKAPFSWDDYIGAILAVYVHRCGLSPVRAVEKEPGSDD